MRFSFRLRDGIFASYILMAGFVLAAVDIALFLAGVRVRLAALAAVEAALLLLAAGAGSLFSWIMSKNLSRLSSLATAWDPLSRAGLPAFESRIEEVDALAKKLSSMYELEREHLDIVERSNGLMAQRDRELMLRDDALERSNEELRDKTQSLEAFSQRISFVLDRSAELDIYEVDLAAGIIDSMGKFRLFADPSLKGTVRASALIERFVERPEGVYEQYQTAIEACKASGKTTEFQFEHKIVDGRGQQRWLRNSGRIIPSRGAIVGTLIDISDEIVQREALTERIKRDELTGLYSRYVFREIVDARVARNDPGLVAYVTLDIDGLKEINAKFSSSVGDQVLFALAQRMKQLENRHLVFFRLSGDEFGCLLTGIPDEESLDAMVRKVGTAFDEYIAVGQTSFRLKYSGGIAVLGRPSSTTDELVAHAEFAMYRTASQGYSSIQRFEMEQYREHVRRKARKSEIDRIIQANLLYPVYQPIVSLATGEIWAFEGLSRCTSSHYPHIHELIEDALDSGRLDQLGRLMFDNCVKGFRPDREDLNACRLFVNSTKYGVFTKHEVDRSLEEIFKRINFVIELTEVEKLSRSEIEEVSELIRYSGSSIALDDFGSGYANELTLLALRPDILKIDMEIIRNIDTDRRKQLIFRNLVDYARLEGIKVVAEGVETEGEFSFIREAGADFVQGWYIARADRIPHDIDTEARRKILS